MPEEQEVLVVHGRVTRADGSPLVGVTVSAVDRDLRAEQPLGTAATGPGGRYRISYDRSQFARGEKDSADLLLRVLRSDDVLHTSPIMFNVGPDVEVDIVVLGDRPPSEYETLLGELKGLLQGHPLVDLTQDAEHDDVTFLAGETGREEVQILFVILAFRLAARTAVRPEVFYGLFRSNLPTDLADLLSQDIDVCRRGLESAIDENIVPARLREQLDDIMDRIAGLSVEIAVTVSGHEGRPVLADVLTAVGVDPVVQTAFMTRYLGPDGSIREFWDGIRAAPDLRAHADVLERTLQFSALSGNHPPLVQRLHEMAEAGGVRTLRDLAALGEGGWLALIEGPEGTGVPDSVTGDDEQARAQAYAGLMSDATEDAFPSAVLTAHLAAEGVAANDDLVTFLQQNEDFDIISHRLPDYLEGNPNALDGVADPIAMVRELTRVQRVYRCAPRYRQASVLLDDGLDSAFSIVRTGHRTFVGSYAGRLGGEGEARRIFERASQSNAMALHLLAELGSSFNRTPLGVVTASTAAPVPGVPDWEALFGSLDMCACEHCRSVYSPAAYFVDVLHFLAERPAITGGFAGDILLSRRPDLGEIELTCQNTNTPLPYVDLVNEVLEAAVAPLPSFAAFNLPAGAIAHLDERTIDAAVAGAFSPALAPSARVTVQEPGQRWLIDDSVASYAVRLEAGSPHVWRRGLQTRGTAKELAANPEYVLSGAYDVLRAQAFPWSLPFDLWTSTVRRYLAHLGIQRADLMAVMLGEIAGPSASAAMAIAAERLGMTPQERKIITAAALAPPREPAEFWGLRADAAATWPDEFASLRTLLDRTGLTYQGVLDLLKTSFVNPSGAMALRSTDSEDQATCDPAKLELTGLDEAALGRLHRFERLRAKLNWAAADLDLAAATLRAHVNVDARLDDELIRRLAHVQRLRDRMHVGVDQVLALWSNISIAGEGSLYQRLFQNPSVLSPIDPDFALAGPDLAILIDNPANALISTHAASIEAALRIDATALATITTPADAVLLAGLPPGDRDALLATRTGNDDLNLANLSTIYRVSTLARAVGMSVPDTVQLLELTLFDPFDIARPEQTLRFMELADVIRTAGFRVAELGYLLRNSSSGPGAAAAAESVIAARLGELRGGLRRIAAEYPADVPSDPTGELVRKALSIVLAPVDVDRAMSLLVGTWNDHVAAAAFIDDHLAAFLVPADAKARLIGPEATVNPGEPRFLYVVTALHAHLRGIQSEQFVVQSLGVGLGLEARVVERLLSWVLAQGSPTEPALADLLAPALTEDNPERELTSTSLPDQFATLLRLNKIALVMRTLSISATQLDWIIEQGPGVGWYDLRRLPISATPSTANDFAAFVRLIDLARLRAELPAGEAVLDGMFALATEAAATPADVVAFLSDHIGWAREDIEFLLGPTTLDAAFPAVFADERGIARLLACFKLVRRLGVSARQARSWAEPELDSASARAAVQAVRAKYDDDEWLALSPRLRDQLRDQQRAALVSYLVRQRDAAGMLRWRDTNALYAHFLIDVEMSPCQLTSRIRQAMASAQLFAQRCLMNLEPDVQVAPANYEAWAQWRWMKNYRVWEANRKTFLYPENWVEPELRDDKSVIFQEFESEIQQADVTPASAEDAFVHYLEKLDDVAWLDVVAEYHEQEFDVDGHVIHDVLHVIGRSFTSPRRYFYRRRHNGARWTGWDPIGLDIIGDQVVAVVWNRRLHLCWLTFTEKTEEQPIEMPPPGGTLSEPTHYWKIQLAWSEYKRGRWMAKRLSEQWIEGEMISWLNLLPPLHAFTCKAFVDDTRLAIRVYAYIMPGLIFPWPIAQFMFDGCGSGPLVEIIRTEVDVPLDVPPVVLADGTLMEGMQLVEAPELRPHTGDRLVLQAGTFPTTDVNEIWLNAAKQRIPTLQRTPGRFRLLTPAQDEQFASQRPFFYADERRSYHLTPRSALIPPRLWYRPDYLDPAGLDQVLQPLPAGSGQRGAASGGGAVVDPRNGRPARPRFVDSARPATTPTTTMAPVTDIGGLLSAPGSHRFVPTYRGTKHYRFEAFSHPFVCSFIRELNRGGIDALMTRANQQLPGDDFATVYGPLRVVDKPYPRDQVDFSYAGAYSLYNWEVFFHAPLLVADRLTRNQQFEAAQAWFHYIFDPTDSGGGDVPERYWRTLPFFEAAKRGADQERIDDLLRQFAEQTADPEMTAMVQDWRDHPFKPHAVARLRPGAYQKAVVMRYIDNLLQWGDQLFATDRGEAINEATQLYVLAADILGRRPQQIPPRATADTQTFNSLPPLDDFSNALVQIESFIAPSAPTTTATDDQPQLTLPTMLYFCVPSNDKLLKYWDEIADRLFKIRHCMNIAGQVRPLPLFDPPIPPELLVRAEATGVDIGSVLSDTNAPAPHHRYAVLMQKATQLCDDLKGLGAALLSALEKRDAEELALLRSTHEVAVLNAMRAIRQRQVDEVTRALDGLRRTRELAELRYTFYRTIARLSPLEALSELLAGASMTSTAAAQATEIAAMSGYAVPDGKIGSPPTAGFTYGGSQLGAVGRMLADAFHAQASILSSTSGMLATRANYQRRYDEWKLQERLAAKEIEQVDQQIAAAEIRLAMSERELTLHEQQTKNASELDELMRSKYTNRELYDWTVGQISAIYFQSYRLAYDLAQRTERAFRFELGLQESNFIQFGYWDSLKRGLVAGERLHLDLQRMDSAYLDQHTREYELVRHVSLAQLDPMALVQLRQTGECFVSLPEALFDLDCPGHYLRRIHSLSLSIPCVTGPYTSVNCTVRQLKSTIRFTSGLANGQYARQQEDLRFADSVGTAESIVTSGGQTDGGVFELNARDERYLPFEGTGVISDWHIALSDEFRQFDYDTIADVIMHLRYTSRDGGGELKTQALSELVNQVNTMALAGDRQGLALLLSARRDLSNQWSRFLDPGIAAGDQTLTIDLTQNRLPYLFAGRQIRIDKVDILVGVREEFSATHTIQNLNVSLAPGAAGPTQPLPLTNVNGLLHAEWTAGNGALEEWTLAAWLDDGAGHERLNPNALEDVVLITRYTSL